MAREGLTFGSVREIAGDKPGGGAGSARVDAAVLARPGFGKSGAGARSK
jgi:hypothetical protein